MADWARLNHDLLIEIVERLPSMESYEYFGEVCRSWNAAATKIHLKRLTCFEAPSLMFAEKDENNIESRELDREFSSIISGFKTSHKIFLPEGSRQFCLPCKDWLLVTSLDETDASLLHPLTRVQIHLPKLTTFPSYDSFVGGHGFNFIEKAILSANPATTSDFIVMVTSGFNGSLGFWKSGDTSWTWIDYPIDYHRPTKFDDMLYCNNKLYGVNGMGCILSCDIHGPNPTQLVQVFSNFPEHVLGGKSYLVGLSEDKILVVFRYHEHPTEHTYHTTGFKIFEVKLEDGTWLEVQALGNKALFLGNNSSFSFECTEINKCLPNCIYFSDDYFEGYSLVEGTGGGKDMGIYHLSDGSIQHLFDDDDIVLSKITPPTWIAPSF